MRRIKKNQVFYIIFAVVILALVLLVFFFSFRAYKHYTALKSHENYFKQPNPEIEPWMTTHLIIRKFNISEEALFKELKVNDTRANQRQTIYNICKKNHLNCTEVVSELNRLKTQ